LSGNGTLIVGKRFLESKGDEMEIRDGDIVRLVQTGNNGTQIPFMDFRFHSQAEVDPVVPKSEVEYILAIRNLETLVDSSFPFSLNGNSRLIQIIGKNQFSGMTNGLIDVSHFGIMMGDKGGHVVVRSISEKGVIVGSDFVPKGVDKMVDLKKVGVEIYFPGVSSVGMRLTCAGGGGAPVGGMHATMLGVPPLFNTARHQQQNPRW